MCNSSEIFDFNRMQYFLGNNFENKFLCFIIRFLFSWIHTWFRQCMFCLLTLIFLCKIIIGR